MKRLILFHAGGEQFALDLSTVTSIHRAAPLPGEESRAGVRDHVTTGGRTTPLLDLAFVLGGSAPCSDRMSAKVILTRAGGKSLALAVERLDGVVEVEDVQIRRLPPVCGEASLMCFPLVLSHENKLILVLDSERILEGSMNEETLKTCGATASATRETGRHDSQQQPYPLETQRRSSSESPDSGFINSDPQSLENDPRANHPTQVHTGLEGEPCDSFGVSSPHEEWSTETLSQGGCLEAVRGDDAVPEAMSPLGGSHAASVTPLGASEAGREGELDASRVSEEPNDSPPVDEASECRIDSALLKGIVARAVDECKVRWQQTRLQDEEEEIESLCAALGPEGSIDPALLRRIVGRVVHRYKHLLSEREASRPPVAITQVGAWQESLPPEGVSEQ